MCFQLWIAYDAVNYSASESFNAMCGIVNKPHSPTTSYAHRISIYWHNTKFSHWSRLHPQFSQVMARLRRKYPPKRVLPQAAYQQSPNAMLPPFAPSEDTSTIANPAAPSPSLLQPLLSNTSSSSSVSTISARIKSESVGSLGVASASSSEFYFDGPDVGNAGPHRQLHVVGSPLIRRNVTPDGQLHAASFARSRIVLPRSRYHLASPKVGNAPSKNDLSANIGATQYSTSASTKTPNESTTSAPSLPKTSSIISRKIHRYGASSILGLGSSSIAALTNRHRHDL
ncbi:uncharacterized protein V1513DRAFT_445818 [Lipomyces chichibuensis]|uniref:uncharacterized protein n=1 Tax=Lipomyces chichibuensis TaxID=1546026 RepID=UPI0033434633